MTRKQITCAAIALSIAVPAAAQEEVPPMTDEVPDDGTRAREDNLETARTLGMGTGGRASAIGTSAIAQNPANLAMARLYHMEAFATYVPGQNAWAFGSAVADSVTNKMAAGLSMRGIYGNGDRNYRGYDGRLSVGLPLSQAIGLGVSARYLRVRSKEQNEAGERVGDSARAFTVDAAIRITATDGLHIAALGYNLIPTDSSLAPTLLGGSVSYSIGNVFTAAVDVLVDMTTFDDRELIFGGGLEYLAAETVALRAGYRREQGRELNQVSASVGYVDRQMGIDISLRQDVASDDRESMVLVSFRYHVQ